MTKATIIHHTATADSHITKTGPDSFTIDKTKPFDLEAGRRTVAALARLDAFIKRLGDETQAREGPAESRMTGKHLTIARAAFRAGVKAGAVATTDAAVRLIERQTPAPAGGPLSITNAMRVIMKDAAGSLLDYDHLEPPA